MIKKKNKKLTPKEKPTKVKEVVEEEQPRDIEEEEEVIEEEPVLEEGQLSVDVYQEGPNIIIKSTIAGVEPEDIDITFDNDMITIRGERHNNSDARDEDYFFQECYWGSFSRSIILPVDVDTEQIEATIRNGVLTITLPKAEKKDVEIRVIDQN